MSRTDLYLNCSLRWRGGRPGQGPNSLDLSQGKLQTLSSVSMAGSGLKYCGPRERAPGGHTGCTPLTSFSGLE